MHGFGPNSAGELLTRHPEVDGITFTGETATGAAIMKAAADGVRPVSFELGGKNAAIVFADCDFEAALDGTSRSVFANVGQVCLGTERVFVERPIFDRFVAALAERAKAFRFGDPHDDATTMGPLISLAHRAIKCCHITHAHAPPARRCTPAAASRTSRAAWRAGAFVEPTVWSGLGDDAAVMREEIFGPCAHVSPFDTEDEAVARANDTRYGLATSIWTRDLSRAHRVAGRIEVGIAWVNSWFLRDLRTSFGGAKQSGIGREGGVHGLEFYTELRNVCVKL